MGRGSPRRVLWYKSQERQYFKKKRGVNSEHFTEDKPNNVSNALYKVPKTVKLIDTKSRMVAAMGWGEGSSGSWYLMGITLQLLKTNKL